MMTINFSRDENRKLDLENFLLARHLYRIRSSKILETFDDYVNENEMIKKEINLVLSERTLQPKLPKIMQRLSSKYVKLFFVYFFDFNSTSIFSQ